MNNMWSDDRRRKLEQNVKSLITCIINTDFSCCAFYEKMNKNFLKKVLSTERNNWANV